MSHLDFSVIIASYNSATMVGDAIDSALRQTVAPREIIVVDDGSTDDTPAVLSAWGDRIRVIRQENRGLSGARNRGIAEARGEWIAILDADDAFHPRKLERQRQALEADPNLDALGTATCDWPRSRWDEPHAGAPRVRVYAWDEFAVRNYLAASSVVVRRSVFEALNRFDPAVSPAEDHDLWIRILERGGGVGRIEEPLTGYRQTPGSLSKRPALMEQALRGVLRKIDERGAWSAREGGKSLRRQAYGYACCSCAWMHRQAGHRGRAVRLMAESFAWHPLPYGPSIFQSRLHRPKMLARFLWELAAKGTTSHQTPQGP